MAVDISFPQNVIAQDSRESAYDGFNCAYTDLRIARRLVHFPEKMAQLLRCQATAAEDSLSNLQRAVIHALLSGFGAHT